MSIMEDQFYKCEHCGQLVDTFKNIKEPHDCYMKHIHKVLDTKNNKNNRNKSNGPRRIWKKCRK